MRMWQKYWGRCGCDVIAVTLKGTYAVDKSNEDDDCASFDSIAAVRLNRQRMEVRFVSAARNGLLWLIECRDLGDAFDADAGVYFEECADDAAVDRVVARCTEGNPYDRVLGIFDLGKTLETQGGGMTRAEWLAGNR